MLHDILYSQKLKKAKLHVAAQKVPKPKSLFKTSSTMTSVTSTATSPSVMGKPLNKKLTATVKKKGETNKHGLLSSASISSILEGDSNGGVSWGGEEGGERSKKVSEGSETVKPPPVLPGDLPEDIATAVKHFEEVCGCIHCVRVVPCPHSFHSVCVLVHVCTCTCMSLVCCKGSSKYS